MQSDANEKLLPDNLAIVANWLAKLTTLDLDDIVADGGITAGMVIKQEAIHMRYLLSAPRTPSEPVEEHGAWEQVGYWKEKARQAEQCLDEAKDANIRLVREKQALSAPKPVASDTPAPAGDLFGLSDAIKAKVSNGDAITAAESFIPCLVARIATLEAERDAAFAKGREGEPDYRLLLLDLLAVIHRDGGHRTQELGVKLSHEHASERMVALYANPTPPTGELVTEDALATLSWIQSQAESIMGTPDDGDGLELIASTASDIAINAQMLTEKLQAVFPTPPTPSSPD